MTDDLYKISVYSSKLGIPLNFVVHTHIVTEHNGVKHRFDVFAPFTIPPHKQSPTGNIFKDFLPYDTGFLKVFRSAHWWNEHSPKSRWQAQEHSFVQGGMNSPAHMLYNLINSDALMEYPGTHRYRFIAGPNSNTFTQWVIDQVPEVGLTLPWNAWGKGCKCSKNIN